MGICASGSPNTVSPETSVQQHHRNTESLRPATSTSTKTASSSAKPVPAVAVMPNTYLTADATGTSLSRDTEGATSPSTSTRGVSHATANVPPPSTPKKRSTVKHKKWKKGDLIGAGSYGRVFMGMDTETGALLAIKELVFSPDDSKEIQSMQLEIDLMKSLDHPNIVKYLGTEMGDTDNLLYIFTEWVPGGSLQSLLKKFGSFDEPVTQKYTFQILQGLHFLHVNRVVHRDIKGANVLIDDKGTVKLADFGASKQLSGTLATLQSDNMSLRGTPYFMAPEVITQTGHGRKADIWSVGCTVLQMITGYPPWKSMKFGSISALMYHVANAKDPPPMPERVSSALRSFLIQCFQRDPDKRPGADQLMQHEFVVGVSQDFADMTVGNDNSINIIRAMDTSAQRASYGSANAGFDSGGALQFPMKYNDDDAIPFDDTGALGNGQVLGTLSLTSDGDALSPLRSEKAVKDFEPAEPFDIGSFSMKGELPRGGSQPAPEETIRNHLTELGRQAERLALGVCDGAESVSEVSTVRSPPIGDPSANPFSRVNNTIGADDNEAYKSMSSSVGGNQSNNNPQENSLTVSDGDAAAAAAAMQASYLAVVERPIVTDTALRNAELAREAEEKRKKIEAEKRSQWEKELEMERQLQRSMNPR